MMMMMLLLLLLRQPSLVSTRARLELPWHGMRTVQGVLATVKKAVALKVLVDHLRSGGSG